MKTLRILCLLTLGGLTLSAGCDSDRLNRLEKENQEMKAKLEKDDAARNYDLQAKCGKDARIWFNENWSRDKDTTLLDFSNHYNAKQNKCFIFVEVHYNFPVGNLALSSWTNVMSVTDVYENAKHADFTQNHTVNGKPDFKLVEPVVTCDVEGTKCKSIDEFNNLIRPYMND